MILGFLNNLPCAKHKDILKKTKTNKQKNENSMLESFSFFSFNIYFAIGLLNFWHMWL